MRALLRTPGFTGMSVTTLGLAIGVTAGLFSVVNAVLIHPLPYVAADRLVYIAATAPGSDLPAEFGVSAEFFVHYKEQSRLLEDVGVLQLVHVDAARGRSGGAGAHVIAERVAVQHTRRPHGDREAAGRR